MEKDVIVALDVPSGEDALRLLDQFGSYRPFVKIGMELFYREGPSIVKQIGERGNKIFLDLKLHDIPHTVYGAMKSLSTLPVDIVDVHASGCKEMMAAAREAFEGSGQKMPLIIAVTALTSLDENALTKQLLVTEPVERVVEHYAKNAQEAGLDGCVCSPLEVSYVRKACGDNFVTVTPGIRFATDAKGDQKRFATPEDAKHLGSNFIVMGRSITQAQDPCEAYRQAMKQFAEKEL